MGTPEKRASQAVWYQRNAVRLREKNRRYRELHRAEIKEVQNRAPSVVSPSPERRARMSEASKRWRLAHPDATDAVHAAARANTKAKKLGLPGRLQTADVLAMWQRQPACLKCGIGRGVDHIVPFRLRGTNTIDNIQTLCRRCNSAKDMYARHHGN